MTYILTYKIRESNLRFAKVEDEDYGDARYKIEKIIRELNRTRRGRHHLVEIHELSKIENFSCMITSQ